MHATILLALAVLALGAALGFFLTRLRRAGRAAEAALAHAADLRARAERLCERLAAASAGSRPEPLPEARPAERPSASLSPRAGDAPRRPRRRASHAPAPPPACSIPSPSAGSSSRAASAATTQTK